MPRRKTRIKREKLLKSAIEVFGMKGFQQASIPQITKNAGVATGTFYLYFKDKLHIFIESLNYITLQLRDYLDKAFQDYMQSIEIRSQTPEDAHHAIYAVYNAFFDYVDKYQKQFLIIFREGMSYHPEFSEVIWNILRELMNDTRTRINTGLQLNIIRKMTRQETEFISWAIVGMLYLSAQAYLEENYDRENLVEALINFTIKGIQKGG